ncbi:MAG: M28 family metallopeptidase, partial [Promethearchaeota archaeon]
MTVINILKQDNYKGNAVLDHIHNLNYGRAVGSIGEKRAIRYIANQIISHNGNIQVEQFNYISRNFMFKKMMRNVFLIIFGVISFSILQDVFNEFFFFSNIYLRFLEMFLIVTDFLMIVLSTYFFFTKYLPFNLKLITKFDRQFKAEKKNKSYNLVSNVENRSLLKHQKGAIIFSAHYDSISTNYRLKYFFSQLFIIGITTAIYTNLTLPLFQHISYGTALAIITSSLFLFKFENKSKGSIDNASGVALLLELNQLFIKNPLNNFDMIFLWTGAEEIGLWGAREYCNHHFLELSRKYDLNNSFYINLDMVGTQLGIIGKSIFSNKVKKNNSLSAKFLEISKKREIPVIQHKKSPFAISDNKVFEYYAEKYNIHLESCWINSKNDIKFIHSSKDTINLCSEYELNKCFNVCQEL